MKFWKRKIKCNNVKDNYDGYGGANSLVKRNQTSDHLEKRKTKA